MSKKTKLKETPSAGPTIVAKCQICKFPLVGISSGAAEHFCGETQEERQVSIGVISVYHSYYERTRFDSLARSTSQVRS